MHGSRKHHNTTTAELEIDEEIGKQRDNGRKVDITNRDLTVAYETALHSLLLNKLEHIGVCEKELKLMMSYFENRKVQGFFSQTMKLPPMSVVQSSKLSGTLYTQFTLDTHK